VKQAAASHDVLVAVTVAVLGGGVILFPSLVLLFRLTLGGRLGHGHEEQAATPGPGRRLVLAAGPGLLGRVAAACLLAGFALLTVAEAGWAHAIGVVALFGFIVAGFAATVPALLESEAGA
jgi:cytochrome d ubiquinol oxidase subunit II